MFSAVLDPGPLRFETERDDKWFLEILCDESLFSLLASRLVWDLLLSFYLLIELFWRTDEWCWLVRLFNLSPWAVALLSFEEFLLFSAIEEEYLVWFEFLILEFVFLDKEDLLFSYIVFVAWSFYFLTIFLCPIGLLSLDFWFLWKLCWFEDDNIFFIWGFAIVDSDSSKFISEFLL